MICAQPRCYILPTTGRSYSAIWNDGQYRPGDFLRDQFGAVCRWGWGLVAGATPGSGFPGLSPTREAPSVHHVHSCRRRAGVHRARVARPGWIPGRLHRPDPLLVSLGRPVRTDCPERTPPGRPRRL